MRKRGREMEWEIERKCVCMCVLPVCVCDCTRCCTRQTNAELKTQKQASVMEMEAGKYVSESNRLMSMWSLQHTVRLQGLSFHTHKWCHYLYTFRVYTFFFFCTPTVLNAFIFPPSPYSMKINKQRQETCMYLHLLSESALPHHNALKYLI